MFNKFISALMIGALALSTIATTPAMARDRNDNARLIAGIAALAIVGVAVASSSKSRNDGYVGQDQRYGSNDRNDGYDRGRDQRYDQGRSFGQTRNQGYGHAQPATLPGACRVHAGNRSGYSGRCLSNTYAGYNSLPRACEVHIGGRHRTVYRDSCLNQYGYY